jgi:hypothetical protein
MDVSLDHEPTLIERGTVVHLNYPITTRRGTHDSCPAQWELWTPHPSVPRKDGEGAYGQECELPPIASTGPRLRGLDARLHFLACTERRQLSIRAHGTSEAG